MASDRKFWNKIARKYATSKISDMASYEYTLARTQSHLLQTDHVLELGCGTGSTALVLAPCVGAYLGTDLSDEMIAIAREKNAHDGVAHLRFDTFDLRAHQMDQQFDAILAFNLLHLVPDLNAALRRIDHMLKPGGVFISKTICYSSDWRGIALRAIMAVVPILRAFGKAPYAKITTIPDLHSRIDALGYKVLEQGNHPASPPRRYIVARKPA